MVGDRKKIIKRNVKPVKNNVIQLRFTQKSNNVTNISYWMTQTPFVQIQIQIDLRKIQYNISHFNKLKGQLSNF